VTLLLGTPRAVAARPPAQGPLPVVSATVPPAGHDLPPDRGANAREGRMDVDALFAQFVRDQTGTLLRSAYLLTGSTSSAEDLVQDTFLRLYPKWQRVMSADVPIAYVRRALVNGFLNQRRRPASREIVVADLPEQVDGRDIGLDISNRDLIWRLLDTLSDRQRAALVMRYFHDLADDEIAEGLSCRLGTVRSLISRGLAALRDEAARSQAAASGYPEGRPR
jgi:RNA polymerase sigma-70 factor (sigma-E family)